MSDTNNRENVIIQPKNTNQSQVQSHIKLEVTDPPDFGEGGREYRRNILISTSTTVVLILSSSLKPELFGIEIPIATMWLLLGVAHVYFFIMWRLTCTIESDKEKRFWNIRGLVKQALIAGTKGFPGKTRAQVFFIRALPIWAFILGVLGISLGYWQSIQI
ncbi:hypothetical protein [Nitrosomonas sp.]|uniref:hypothetical protein n=1 Tax=Nitrosomonas sp. TaxID=42353 RepID=UPI00283EB4A1|nr:hypothetical protein [Nitrosomonas sp.]MDR4515619.1 hypothetical protein [Nitrosomonas sp.]